MSRAVQSACVKALADLVPALDPAPLTPAKGAL